MTKCCGCISCSKETRDTFAEMMNFSLLKDAIFVIFAVSNFCTSIGFNMPYLYVVSQAETLDISKKDASYLIASIGVANTVGRIILGYIADKPWVNRLLIYNVCLTACGVGKPIGLQLDWIFVDMQSLVFWICSHCDGAALPGLQCTVGLLLRFWFHDWCLCGPHLGHPGGSAGPGEADQCVWTAAALPGHR